MSEIGSEQHEVERHLHECETKFRALRAVAFLMEQTGGNEIHATSDDDRLDLTYLLRLIADEGHTYAEQGLLLAQKMRTA